MKEDPYEKNSNTYMVIPPFMVITSKQVRGLAILFQVMGVKRQ